MATIREKSPGVWEVRVSTGRDDHGRPTQVSRTVRGGERGAQRVAVQLEGGPGRSSAAGRTVRDVLDEWVEHHVDTWAASSARDQRSRVKAINADDKLARMPVARRRWPTSSSGTLAFDAPASRTPGSRTCTVSSAPRSRKHSDGTEM